MDENSKSVQCTDQPNVEGSDNFRKDSVCQKYESQANTEYAKGETEESLTRNGVVNNMRYYKVVTKSSVSNIEDPTNSNEDISDLNAVVRNNHLCSDSFGKAISNQTVNDCTVVSKSIPEHVFPANGPNAKHYSKKNKHSGLLIYDSMLCEICGEIFMKHSAFQKHIYKHTGNTLNKHTCEICFQNFARMTDFKTHKLKHEEIVSFVCDLCDMRFDEKEELTKHRKSHGIRNIPCKLCGKVIGHRNNMKSHIQTHSEDRTFPCRFSCNKSFKTLQNRSVHEQCVHVKSKRYECGICSRKFYAPKDIKEHMFLKHTTKKLECKICSTSFASRPGHYMHMKRFHGDSFGAKLKFRCEKCSRMFACTSDLERHRAKHVPKRKPAKAVKPRLRQRSCSRCGELCPIYKFKEHACKDKQELIFQLIDGQADILSDMYQIINTCIMK